MKIRKLLTHQCFQKITTKFDWVFLHALLIPSWELHCHDHHFNSAAFHLSAGYGDSLIDEFSWFHLCPFKSTLNTAPRRLNLKQMSSFTLLHFFSSVSYTDAIQVAFSSTCLLHSSSASSLIVLNLDSTFHHPELLYSPLWFYNFVPWYRCLFWL